jgi:hypothetical protein
MPTMLDETGAGRLYCSGFRFFEKETTTVGLGYERLGRRR